MKAIIGISMVFLLITGCSPGEPNVCEFYYQILFREKTTSICIKSKTNILEYYLTDSINVFQKKALGIENTFVEYITGNENCIFLKTNTVYPNDTIIIGNKIGKQDTIYIEINSENAKYYLNSQYKYEILDAFKKGVFECIIEI